LTREEWTRGPGTHPVEKGSSGLQVGPGRRRGTGLESMGNIWEEDAVFSYESMLQFFRPKYMPSWPVFMKFRQNVIRKIKCWVDNQYMATWYCLSSNQRKVRKLISGLNPTTKSRLLSFSWTQSMVVIDLLTGHNTVRRRLYLLGLTKSPLCRRCGEG
jgi:hypothetical protein